MIISVLTRFVFCPFPRLTVYKGFYFILTCHQNFYMALRNLKI
jgi:hypothetical protein